eukprot:5200573-Pleurochrysis_carterae.AAC.2
MTGGCSGCVFIGRRGISFSHRRCRRVRIVRNMCCIAVRRRLDGRGGGHRVRCNNVGCGVNARRTPQGGDGLSNV